MSNARVFLCLVFLIFLTSPLVLCSSSPKVVAVAASASTEEAPKRHIDPPAMLVSESIEVDSSSSMAKIDDEPATNSAISGFFRYRFPFYGWPFPMVKPANPSVPATPVSGASEEESEKVPSSPSEGNRDGGNA
ncbi:hypothetical protein DY000_02009648 [Brassica cretica]|uniref:Uncharacterized protein n=1 Tax=Brassica cretica TaxID=69181 RepID=A0ABQ7C3D1_BRACR|nr:hypothetical protein DY000_02009648 [Brassica cretica]